MLAFLNDTLFLFYVVTWPVYPDECLTAELIAKQSMKWLYLGYRLLELDLAPQFWFSGLLTQAKESEFVCSLRVSSA